MGLAIKGVFTKLTPAEKWFLVRHPWLIDDIRDAADKASAEAKKRFVGKEQHNGNGDAFRHCYWSALMSRDIGLDDATKFSTAHENYSKNPAGERAMDLHNNAVGVQLGQVLHETSDKLLADHCEAALKTGVLITAPPTTGKPY